MTEKSKGAGDHLKGLKIVLTGDFDAHERDVATRLLTERGASVTGSVSGKTSVVIAGRDAGQTKLGEAKKRNLPVLNEAQLLALIAGQTLEEVLSGASGGAKAAVEEGSQGATKEAVAPGGTGAGAGAPGAAGAGAGAGAAEEALKIPFPEVTIPPRDGEYEERYPGTDKVRVRGTYKAGLRHGSWKKWDESGQLREDYSFEKGLAHGPELDWWADGAKCCVGENRNGKRVGLWQWYHENGKPSYSYIYDDAGLKDGEHLWDLPDGQKRARGVFVADKFHGHWTWWHEPEHERVERDYHHGQHHGVDEAWFPGGHLAYRRTWVYGRKDGLEEVYRKAPGGGSVLASRGEWKAGFPVGEHLEVDEAGKETRSPYVAGLSEAARDASVGEKALKKLKKATSSYSKVDAFGEGVEYSERAPNLLHLWRQGKVDVAGDPELWELFSQAAALLTGEEVVKLLGAITSTKEKDLGHGSFLPSWSDYLDRITMVVYSTDPGPIDAAAAKLPDRMRKGVSFVQARFGRKTSLPLAKEIGELAKKHVDQWGLGQRVDWPDQDGRVIEQNVFADYKYAPTPMSAKLLGLFGTEEAWAEALRARAEAMIGDTRLPFRLLRPLLERATPEDMIRYLDAVGLDNDTQDLIHTALTEWRKDDTDTLVRIALGVTDTGLRKWPTVSAALLALAAEGKKAPAELVEALPLATESPTYSSGWVNDPLRDLTDDQKKDPAMVFSRIPIGPGCAVPRIGRLRAALATLPKEAITRKLDAQLEKEYGKTEANQFLHLVDDPALWARAFKAVETASYGHSDASVYGLGDIGEKAIPLILALQKKVKGKDWKEGVAKALLVALTRTIVETGTLAPAHDKHVSFSAIAKDYDYRSYEPFLHRLIHLLPTERAEPLLLEGLASKHFSRAFRMIGSHPTPKVLRAAFTELLARESTFKSEDQTAVGLGLASLPEPKAWVKWILRSGGGGGMRDALRNAIGHAGIEEVEKELASAGVEKAAEIDDVEKVRLRAAKEGGGSERIYLLRKLEGDGHGKDLNRIGGAAPGVGPERWPTVDGDPMTHLFTLDLDTMPELRARVSCEDGGVPRAVSVFCMNPDDNEAYEPDTEETAVVVSSAAQVAVAAEPPGEAALHDPGKFEAVAVDVPPSVWKSRSSDLRSEIYRCSGRALGEPIWLQSAEHFGSFLCQFDEGFVSMNLGDTGVMYVFSDTAFWQCH